MKNIFNFRNKKQTEERDCNCYADSVPNFFNRNKNSAMSLSTVFRCVDLISDSIAILPIQIKVRNGNCINTLENHSLNYVLSDRNLSHISKYNLIKLLVQSVLLRGNGYAYIHRSDDGTPTELQYLEASDVVVQYNKQTNDLFYISSLIRGRINPRDIIHLKKYSYDGINGISVISFASRSVELAQNAENNASSFFQDGSNLKGILTVQGTLSQAQRDQIKAAWSSNDDKLKVLAGNMSYTPISISPEDSELLSTRKFNTIDICRFFGVNPILIGDLTYASYGTLEQVNTEFVLHTLQGFIKMIEEEFNRKLLKFSESNLYIDLDENYLIRADKNASAQYYSTLLQNGVLCINEVRSELGLSEIEGLDKHIISYSKIEDNIINDNK